MPPPEPKESQVWRLTGFFHIAERKNFVLISNGVDSLRLDYASHCKKEAEMICIYHGEVVASWTGKSEQLKMTGGFFGKS